MRRESKVAILIGIVAGLLIVLGLSWCAGPIPVDHGIFMDELNE